MPLPQKRYFRLPEVARRWQVEVDDLACYALDGLVEISVMAVGLRVEVGAFERQEGEAGAGWTRVPAFEEVLHGPQPVVAADLWPVFRNGSGRLARLKPRTSDGFVEVAGPEPIPVAREDLLVTREERDRFEREHGLDIPEPANATSREPDGFIHSADYTEVVLSGQVFRLGLLQAAVVRRLHEASRGPHPWVSGKELLARSGAQSMRMVDLFKAKPGWRTLIASDGTGRYRLNLPDRPAARVAHRAYRRLRSAAC